MENQPILITSHTSYHSNHQLSNHTTNNHPNQKRQRSSSPNEDQRYIKQRSDSNFVSQPSTPTLLNVTDQIQSRSWIDTPSNPNSRLTFETSSIYNQTHQDVQMECEDDKHSTDQFNMNDSNTIGWSPRSVHTLRRVSTPTETVIPNTFNLPIISSSTIPHPRPQPLHRPHPMAYQQHLALLSQPKSISQDLHSQMSISPPQSPSKYSDLIPQLNERPQRPKNPINYILGPKKGCEDCRKKVVGHYTHL